MEFIFYNGTAKFLRVRKTDVFCIHKLIFEGCSFNQEEISYERFRNTANEL